MAVSRCLSTDSNFVLAGCLYLLSTMEDTSNVVSHHLCKVVLGRREPPCSLGVELTVWKWVWLAKGNPVGEWQESLGCWSLIMSGKLRPLCVWIGEKPLQCSNILAGSTVESSLRMTVNLNLGSWCTETGRSFSWVFDSIWHGVIPWGHRRLCRSRHSPPPSAAGICNNCHIMKSEPWKGLSGRLRPVK